MLNKFFKIFVVVLLLVWIGGSSVAYFGVSFSSASGCREKTTFYAWAATWPIWLVATNNQFNYFYNTVESSLCED